VSDIAQPTAQINAAAEVLKDLFSGVSQAAGKVGSFPPTHQQQQPTQPAMSPALAALFRDGQFLAPPMPVHAAAAGAAAAAAAAAAPTMPLSRRHAGNAALLSLSQAGPHREQRPCNCKRSMCLKMYCECFAAGDTSNPFLLFSIWSCHSVVSIVVAPACSSQCTTWCVCRRLLRAILLLPQLLQHAR
jgi:hypothetical protein